jgi:sodium/potassium/calcium exchanger 4
MRYMIFYSTLDTRVKGNDNKTIRCILTCIIWMGIQTYLLITSLNEMGDLIHVNGSIMGLTFASVAASYPAFMSSIVLAKDGFGDAAITNAMGSNVFNNFIGLGLPWLTYSLVHQNEEYGGMQDGGIVLALVVLTAILILFYILLASSNFVLQYW